MFTTTYTVFFFGSFGFQTDEKCAMAAVDSLPYRFELLRLYAEEAAAIEIQRQYKGFRVRCLRLQPEFVHALSYRLFTLL